MTGTITPKNNPSHNGDGFGMCESVIYEVLILISFIAATFLSVITWV